MPALVPVLGIVIFPILFAIYISLNRWPLFGDISFIGIQNYLRLGSDPVFFQAVGFTLLYTAIVTLPVLVIGYALAAFVRSNRRGAILFRTLFFLPTVVGLSTLSFLYLVELQPGSGTVNVVLKTVGLTDGNTPWFLHWQSGLLIVSALVVWFAGGTTMMLLLGGMQAIPTELYEAAEIDGASRWQREMRVTVPLVKRTIAMSLVLSIIGSFLAFQQFLILTNGGPGSSTTTVVMRVYQEAFVNQQLGSATAMGVVVMFAIAALTSIQLFVLREKD
ncbi:sugar ABC transporter permease [Frondihabitans sucicola]|uniref:Sugar ABC transporter permease n=1 Tax=Frondihabitans sucicola TaxID=1268041 RepID=A0ABM8GNC7_9MICO|nr:sugar ABC transporter permease [Frondihabitans sucicola]